MKVDVDRQRHHHQSVGIVAIIKAPAPGSVSLLMMGAFFTATMPGAETVESDQKKSNEGESPDAAFSLLLLVAV